MYVLEREEKLKKEKKNGGKMNVNISSNIVLFQFSSHVTRTLSDEKPWNKKYLTGIV